MEIFLLSIILFIISIFLFIKANKKIEINKQIEKYNDKLQEDKNKIEKEIDELKKYRAVWEENQDKWKQITAEASDNYYQVLENHYQAEEENYEEMLLNLQKSYDFKQDILINKFNEEEEKLKQIRATRMAAQEALLKEKEIKENKSFYCLTPSQEDLDDVQALERIKPKLHQPRILCMLIWSTYFQKPMTALCNNVIGALETTGVYKITNQETNECYIGQAVDVAKRWKDHVKCGLGIDTPANNKLYKAMQEYGVHNFSFELLEKCKKEELNEKEKYYIELYDAYTYGYNSNTGIKKS